MRRRSLALGCVGLFLVAGCGPMHLFGRYDCRTGAVETRTGTDLLDDLAREAAKAAMENAGDKTSED